MPIYEYSCPRCGTFETTQRITDAPLKRCPTCKSKVERMLSRTSFILKGSGWYATDYGRSGKSGGESKSESKSDSAPANGAATAKSSDSGSADKGGSAEKSSSTSSSSTEKGTPAK